MESATCIQCEEAKPIDGFCSHKNNNGKRYRDRKCRTCTNAASKAYRTENKEHVRATEMASYKKHREKRIEKAISWQKNNEERFKRVAKEYRATEAGRESDAKGSRRWRLKNPDKSLLASKRGRAKRRGAKIGAICKKDLDLILERQRFKCAACLISIVEKSKRHIDHVIPLALRGEHSIRNLQFLCVSCNLSKSSKDPILFMNSRGFLL